jgi:hypothetical protein
MPEKAKGCVQTAAGPLGGDVVQEGSSPGGEPRKEVQRMSVTVGKPAPDFEAIGYHQGEFRTFRLSEHRGRWTMLCFYPGDFTFV